MTMPEFKRSGIGIIAEFHGIPGGFPNQDRGCGHVAKVISDDGMGTDGYGVAMLQEELCLVRYACGGITDGYDVVM